MTTTVRREVLLYAPRYAPAAEVTAGDSVVLGSDVAGSVLARTVLGSVVVLRVRTPEGSIAVVELTPDAPVFTWRNEGV